MCVLSTYYVPGAVLGCGDTATERAGLAPASWLLELRRAGVRTVNEPTRPGDVLTRSGRGLSEDAVSSGAHTGA